MPQVLSRPPAQEALGEAVAEIAGSAPLAPTMPRTGKEMSVRMTNCGPLGLVTDKELGYRYQPLHPVTGEAWPPIPALLQLWRDVSGYSHPPEACLVNFYSDARRWACTRIATRPTSPRPVVSVSLGNDCRFRVGGATRDDPDRYPSR